LALLGLVVVVEVVAHQREHQMPGPGALAQATVEVELLAQVQLVQAVMALVGEVLTAFLS
jgi:hypothetical protein